MKNHEIENQNTKAEKSTVSETREQICSDALSPKNDSRKAFAAMDDSKTSPEVNKMLEATKFTIVDHGAIVNSIDKNGYVPGSVQNSIRAQVGNAEGDIAIARARMMHAASSITTESNEGQRHQNVQARTETSQQSVP